MIPSNLVALPFCGADPFIFKAHEAWWLITSHDAADGRHLPVYRSTDLLIWEFVAGAVEPGGSPWDWNRRNFWAPEVIEHQGRFYCYYTAMPDGTPGNEGNRVGLAIADHPAGPYEDAGVVIPHGSIDGSPFIDSDGRAWLLFTTEHGNDLGWPPGQVGVFALNENLRHVQGAPVPLVTQYQWQEGAFFLPGGQVGGLALLFSYGGWTEDTYCVHAAWGDSPLGPFEPESEAFLQGTPTLRGPGHANVFPGPDGKPWLVFHAWDAAKTGRFPNYAPLAAFWTGAGSRVALFSK